MCRLLLLGPYHNLQEDKGAIEKIGEERRFVEFSQSGPNIVAYEKETDLIHHLNLPEGINRIEDLLNGHEVAFRISIEETAKHYL